MTPVNNSDEQPPHYFFNIIICCTCNMCPRAVEKATHATTRENLSSGFPTNRVLNQSLRLIYTLLKEPFALKNLETVYFTSIFSTQSYSDIAPIDNFDLTFFYFYFVFEVFDTIQF